MGNGRSRGRFGGLFNSKPVDIAKLALNVSAATATEAKIQALDTLCKALQSEAHNQARSRQVLDDHPDVVGEIVAMLSALSSSSSSSSPSSNNNNVDAIETAVEAAWVLIELAGDNDNVTKLCKTQPLLARVVVEQLELLADSSTASEEDKEADFEGSLWSLVNNLAFSLEAMTEMVSDYPKLIQLLVTSLARGCGGERDKNEDDDDDADGRFLDVCNTAINMANLPQVAIAMLSGEHAPQLLTTLITLMQQQRQKKKGGGSRDNAVSEYAAHLCYNLAQPPSTRHVLRSHPGLVDVLTVNRTHKDKSVKSYSSIALTILFGDASDNGSGNGDLNKLLVDGAVLHEAFEDIHYAMNNDGDLCLMSLEESLLVMRYLAVAGNNRAVLWKKHGAKFLKRILGALNQVIDEKKATAAENAVYVLSQFSSDAGPLQWMRANSKEYAPTVARLRDRHQEFEAAHRAAQFWLLSVDPPKVSSSSTASSMVMISYQWQFQKEARAIHSILESLGLSVWRDEQDMKESINDAMADAVGKCGVVLESANCKKELEFAENNKRKLVPVLVEPGYQDFKGDGWLGLLLGSKLYYDVAALRGNKSGMEQVIRTLVDKELVTASATAVAGGGGGGDEIAKPSPPAPPPLPQNEQEIREWLLLLQGGKVEEEDSTDIAAHLASEGLADGEHLKLLCGNRAIELKQLLSITTRQALRLEAALKTVQ